MYTKNILQKYKCHAYNIIFLSKLFKITFSKTIQFTLSLAGERINDIYYLCSATNYFTRQ